MIGYVLSAVAAVGVALATFAVLGGAAEASRARHDTRKRHHHLHGGTR